MLQELAYSWKASHINSFARLCLTLHIFLLQELVNFSDIDILAELSFKSNCSNVKLGSLSISLAILSWSLKIDRLAVACNLWFTLSQIIDTRLLKISIHCYSEKPFLVTEYGVTLSLLALIVSGNVRNSET